MRIALVATLLVLAQASEVAAAPDGVPARPLSIGIWGRHDPANLWEDYEPWTASDVAGFLALHPNAYTELGFEDGKPPGVRSWLAWGEKVQLLRAAAAERGVDLDGRICVAERPDVITHYPHNAASCNPTVSGGGCDWEGNMNGSLGEAETVVKTAGRATDGSPNALVDTAQSWLPDLLAHRLVVLRPRTAGEEERRVTANGPQHLVPDAPWDAPPQPGDAYEVRGSFDPAWVKRVPRATHQAAVARFWSSARNVCGPLPCRPPAQPLDPFDPTNRRGWVPWVDRAAIEALATPSEVPMLYGNVADADDDRRSLVDPHFQTVAVVLDVSNPAYRAWRARYMLYKLRDHGFPRGSHACVLAAYKPGMHTYHDVSVRGPSDMACSEPGTNSWTGPAHVCRDGYEFGGPLHPTPFRAGEYENAVNAYLRELITTLTSNGYPDVRVITAEAPPYEHRTWAILADDVRRNPRLVGEQGGWINPPLASLAALDETGSDPEPDPGDTGTDPGTGPVAGSGDGVTTGPDEPGSSPIPGGGSDPGPGSEPIADGGGEPPAGDGGGDMGSGTGSGSGTTAGSSTGSGAGSGSSGPSGAGRNPTSRAPASAATAPGGDDAEPRGFIASGGGGGGTVEPPSEP